MKIRLFLLLLLVNLCIKASAQKIDLVRIADSVQAEGKMLYRSEMASWYGTDVLTEKYQNKRQLSGGYMSYLNETGATCVFFSKGDEPKIIISFKFDDSYTTNTVVIDTNTRNFSKQEAELYAIRKQTLLRIESDTTFKHYRNTSLNLIPMIVKNQKQVYVITGPQQNGTVLFGNDYLLRFDKKSDLVNIAKIHKGLIVLNTGSKEQVQEASVHSHLPEYSPFITATDICTLMLYEKAANWKFHVVVSQKYVSSWDCNKNKLVILTREAWDRIYADQKSKEIKN